MRSLKSRLTLFTLAIFLIGIGSIAFYTSQVLRKNMEETLGDQQFSTVNLAAAGINQEIEDHLESLKLVAAKISPALLKNPPELQKILEQELILSHMFNAGTLTTGTDGIAITSTPSSIKRIGTNYMDRDYILSALKEGKASISKPYLGRTKNTPNISMSTPIHDTKGVVIGVLAGITDLSKPNFLDRVTESSYGKSGGYVLLVPKDRLIITATDKSRIMTPLPPVGINPALDRFLAGYEGSTVYTNPLGVEVLGSAIQIPAANWLLGLTIPVKEAFAPIRHMILALLVLSLLASFVIWWMLRHQLAPMSDAVKSLAKFSASSLSPTPLQIKRADEIGDLLTGFNNLLATVGRREAELKQITDALPSPVSRLDKEGRYLFVNAAYERWFGKRPDEVVGRLLRECVNPKYYAIGEPYFNRALAGEKCRFEMAVNTPAGESLYAQIRVLPDYNSEKEVCGYFIILSDITERNQAEQEAQTLRDQLTQSTKMEAVGHLTAGIAHDFNNMLGAIMGYTELSKFYIATESPQKIESYLDEIYKASNRAKELIAQMLTFSRLSPDTPGVKAPSTLLTPVVKEVVSLLRASIPSTMDVNYQVEDENLRAFIQPINLHQIILNLGINARDAIGEYGKINITLNKCYSEGHVCDSCQQNFDGEFVQLTISDNGTGIGQQTLKSIFNPFFTTKGVGKGTGMGLSVVHGLVHALGGHIQVETLFGKGTAISVLLPIAMTTSDDELSTNILKQAVSSLVGLRIMLVDDELFMTAMLKEFFNMHGAQTTIFNSPLAAWSAFEQQPDSVDVVITDETMPGLSGMHLAERMLKLRPNLPIILCTGYSDHASPELATQAGLAGFFYKPLKMNELIQKILIVI